MAASNSSNDHLKRMRRTLFVGPTGVGKSTLINMLINDNADVESMSKPAGTSDEAAGQTTYFTTYYVFPDDAYTDSIGLGDNRFDPKTIMTVLKSIIKNSLVGYNKIYLCIRYGRISLDTRRYIDLLIAIFGKGVLKWCSIIFTSCSDLKMTKEQYLAKNKGDANIVEIINQVQTVLFGNNAIDEDPDTEIKFRERRYAFLKRIREDIKKTANDTYFTPEPEDLYQRFIRILQIISETLLSPITGGYHIAKEIKSLAEAAAMSFAAERYSNYFGECTKCGYDMIDGTFPVITKCNHVFHKVCLEEKIRESGIKQCPICGSESGFNRTPFYTDLTSDA